MLTAKEIAEKEKQKKEARKETYKRILSQVNRKIEMAYSLGNTYAIVKIPEFIIGYPSYNMDTVTLYIHRQVCLLGFRSSILSSGLIHVAWGKTEKTQPKELKEEDTLPSLANLKKAANTLRKKYDQNGK